jgi:hypothetical protein
MARPLVLVFQDIQVTPAEPAVPDLNTVLVGPAYVIKDYPDDSSEILLTSTYGQLEQPSAGVSQYTPPITGADAIIVGSYPGNVAGAVVDHASVRAFLRTPRVIIGSTYLSSGIAPVLATNVTTVNTAGNENKVTFTGGVPNLVTAGVRAGDRIVITDSTGTKTLAATISSVGEPDPSGIPTDVATLRLTLNVNTVSGWTFDALGEARIERTLVTQELLDPTFLVFPDPTSDRLLIKGGIKLPVVLTGTTVTQLSISFAEVYLAYRALRQDLTSVDSVVQDDLVIASNGIASFTSIGRIDARNPLAAAMFVALQNAGAAPVYFFGTQSNDAAGHLAARATMDTRRDLYAFIPLTSDTNVLAGYKVEWDQLADPSFALSQGVPQKFRIVVGNTVLPTATSVAPDSITGVTQQPSTPTATGRRRTLSFSGTPAIDVSQVLAGDVVTVGLVPGTGTWSTRRGTHQVGHVNKSTDVPNPGDFPTVELLPGTSAWNDAAGDVTPVGREGGVELLIKSPSGTVKVSRLGRRVLFALPSLANGVQYDMRAPTVAGGPFRIQYSNTGLAPVSVSISGFDVTVGINPGTTTLQQIIDAVNVHPVVSGILTATLVGVSVAQPSAVPFTAIQISFVYRDTTSAGNGIRLTLRNVSTVVPYTITYVNAAGPILITVVGPVITVTFDPAVELFSTVIAAINAHATAGPIVEARLIGVDVLAAGIAGGPTSIDQVDNAYCAATVINNDDLFLWLNDTNALFLTNGVRVGDILEIPIDPNDYTAPAFSGRLLSFPVAQVISEQRVAVANLGDDSPAASNELPHYFLRDIAGRFMDNDPAGFPAAAVRYRIRRNLTKDEQATQLIAVAQSFKSKRVTICYPDQAIVADLKDGSLPRVDPAVRADAGRQSGVMLASAVGGALAGLPAQHGLTNLGFAGITTIFNSSGYFREQQLTRISDGGLFVFHQRVPTELPFCIHQLTTDPSALETGELSVVKNVDFVSLAFQLIIEPFLGQYNALPETLNEISRAITDEAERLKARKLARVGAPLLEGEITIIRFVSSTADRAEVFFRGRVPRPLNGVDFHIIA